LIDPLGGEDPLNAAVAIKVVPAGLIDSDVERTALLNEAVGSAVWTQVKRSGRIRDLSP
jgi:hypothetical protein